MIETWYNEDSTCQLWIIIKRSLDYGCEQTTLEIMAIVLSYQSHEI